jgi:alpha-tubulin suppressor-like RCC1 family protein
MNLRSSFSSVAVHSVFLATNGRLYSWGPNSYHCLGHGPEQNLAFVDTPTELVAPDLYTDGGFKAFAAGEQHNLLLTNKSRIIVWGRNEDGQLGLGHDKEVPTPVPIPNFPDKQIPTQVHCGAHFSAVLTEDGSVYTMGYNDSGQLGDGNQGSGKSRHVPAKVNIPTPVVEITCGWYTMLALTKSGEVYGWGNNVYEQLQISLSASISLPTLSPSLNGFVHLQAGVRHVLGFRDGVLFSWGENNFGPDLKPRSIIPQGCQEVVAAYLNLALMEDGTLVSWGRGSGVLQVAPAEEVQAVVLPPEFTRVAFFGIAAYHAFLISDEGDLYLWGENAVNRTSTLVPTLLRNWKWELPKSYIWVKWNSVIQWLFLGRLDEASSFNQLFSEIIFHFVIVLK